MPNQIEYPQYPWLQIHVITDGPMMIMPIQFLRYTDDTHASDAPFIPTIFRLKELWFTSIWCAAQS